MMIRFKVRRFQNPNLNYLPIIQLFWSSKYFFRPRLKYCCFWVVRYWDFQHWPFSFDFLCYWTERSYYRHCIPHWHEHLNVHSKKRTFNYHFSFGICVDLGSGHCPFRSETSRKLSSRNAFKLFFMFSFLIEVLHWKVKYYIEIKRNLNLN